MRNVQLYYNTWNAIFAPNVAKIEYWQLTPFERDLRKLIYDFFGILGLGGIAGRIWDATFDIEFTVARLILGYFAPTAYWNIAPWSEEYGWN